MLDDILLKGMNDASELEIISWILSEKEYVSSELLKM